MKCYSSQQKLQSQLRIDRDSDDGNPDHSADDQDEETHREQEEQAHNGKRKRPLLVSYVSPFFLPIITTPFHPPGECVCSKPYACLDSQPIFVHQQ